MKTRDLFLSLLLSLALFSVLYGTVYAINALSDGYRIVIGLNGTPPASVTITTPTYSPLCEEVTNNNSTSDVFVPTASQNEWTDFINNHPNYVALNSCTTATSCANVPVTVELYAGEINGTYNFMPTEINGVPNNQLVDPTAGSNGGESDPDNRPGVSFDWVHGTIAENWKYGGGHAPISTGGINLNAVITFSNGTTDLVTNIDPAVGTLYQLPGDWSSVTGNMGCLVPEPIGSAGFQGGYTSCTEFQGMSSNKNTVYGNGASHFEVFLSHTDAVKNSCSINDLNTKITNYPLIIFSSTSFGMYDMSGSTDLLNFSSPGSSANLKNAINANYCHNNGLKYYSEWIYGVVYSQNGYFNYDFAATGFGSGAEAAGMVSYLCN